MIKRKPEGYKDLLVYKKAAALQEATFELTRQFPKKKTLIDLADQMDRSARSGTKNIIEGWKRNTSAEYFTFLGYAVGSIEELKDDTADIAKGLYPDLMVIPGLWIPKGEKGIRGKNGLLQPLNPFSPIKPFPPFTESQLTSFRFYPLDPSLPPVVQLYLRAKEVLMLLSKLQVSLDLKMDEEHTKPQSQKAREHFLAEKQADKGFNDYLKAQGLKRLENGQWVQGNKERNG